MWIYKLYFHLHIEQIYKMMMIRAAVARQAGTEVVVIISRWLTSF